MTAFDWAKIGYFKLEKVASGIDNIDRSVGLDSQAAFLLTGITQAGPFFPSKDVAPQNEESLLHLHKELVLCVSHRKRAIPKHLFEEETTVFHEKPLAGHG